MTTAYNLQRKLDQMRETGTHEIRDPGADGTVQISPFFGEGVLQIDTTGARTLQAAAQVPLGTRVVVFATAGSVTVNTVAVADGEYLEFIRGTDASGDPEWEVFDPTTAEQAIDDHETRIATLEADLLPVNAQTGTSYSLVASDNGKIVTFNNGSAVTVTAPTTLPVGFHCELVQLGAGLVTIQGDGTMVVNTESAALTLNAQHGRGNLVVYATNASNFATYDISGT